MNYGIAGTICLISSVATLALGTTTPATSGANERPTLSLSHVEPYTAEFDYFLDDPGATGQRAGYWTDSLSLAEGRVVRRVERYTSEGRLDLARVVVADHETLAPVRIQQRFGPKLANVYQLEFAGGELTQILIGDAMTPARVGTGALSGPAVETGLQAVFALALPLVADTQHTVSTYVAGAEPRMVNKTFHIVGQEIVAVLGTELSTWRIEDRESQWTYWVRREKPFIVKVSHPMPGGATATSIVTRFD